MVMDVSDETSGWAAIEEMPRMLHELSTPAEMAQLLTDPVYYGLGVPRGDGAPVLVIPGFMASDHYLIPLRGWLYRIGYRSFASTLARNVGCPNELGKLLIERTERIAQSTGRKVTIIGHSKGGLLARAISASRPDLVARVIALGAPFAGDMRANWATESLLAMVRQGMRPFMQTEYRDTCYTPRCQCELVRAFRSAASADIPFTSIYSRSDGVVVWQHCLDVDPSRNIEVHGSHCGLAFNAEVYRHLGRLLASHKAALL